MSSSDTLLSRVGRFIDEHRLLKPGQRVVVGISGGVDSVVLMHVLHRLGYDVFGAHVNYGLRGAASDGDESFVRHWAERLTPPVPVHVARLDARERAEREDESLQEAARNQRYAFFAACAAQRDADGVAVAHHRDDQAETLLLNLFRGSGLEGLGGMAPRRPIAQDSSIQLVRPLLEVSRAAIITYAEAHDLAWRTDASNASSRYARNALRHHVLPIIEAHFEGATDRIAAAAERVRQYMDEAFDLELADRFDQCVVSTVGPGGVLGLEALQAAPLVWRRRVILEALRRWLPKASYTAARAQDIGALLTAQVGRHVDVDGGRVWRERTGLRFVPSSLASKPVEAQTVRVGKPLRLPQGLLRVQTVDSHPERLDTGSPTTEFVDAEAVDGSLFVRTWQDGDRIQPLGMAHTKLVSDLLTDERVPPHQRAEQLVLCDASRVVWVVGHRMAHPVRVRPSTTRVLQFQFDPVAIGSENPLPSGSADW